MKSSRRLVLRTETLTDLELAGLTGGEQLTPQCASTPLDLCIPTTPIIQCVISWPCAELTTR